jgi:hypothetical protein
VPTQTPLLDVLDVTSPCPVAWDSMQGDAQVRFCRQCQHHVYDLSALAQADAESLIREKETRLCARFFRRPDGRILTRDCGQPPGGRARHLLALVVGAGVLLLTAVFASPEARRESYRAVMKWVNPPPRTFQGVATQGIVCLPK